jgi:ABC-type uncharacterized transport system auxiliary subunit
MTSVRRFLLAALLLGLAGCGMQASTTTHQVNTAQDRFSDTIDGKTVSLENWHLSVGDKVIEVPPVESTIVVRRNGGHISVDVNGKTMYQD